MPVPTRCPASAATTRSSAAAAIDTAAYTATISTSGITDDGAGHFVVATGGSEGADTLSGVEKIDGAGTPQHPARRQRRLRHHPGRGQRSR